MKRSRTHSIALILAGLLAAGLAQAIALAQAASLARGLGSRARTSVGVKFDYLQGRGSASVEDAKTRFGFTEVFRLDMQAAIDRARLTAGRYRENSQSRNAGRNFAGHADAEFTTTLPPVAHAADRMFIAKIDPDKPAQNSILYAVTVGVDSTLDPAYVSTAIPPIYANGLAVDAGENAFVSGSVRGAMPTTAGAFQPNYNGAGCRYCSDSFLMKFGAGGALLYSSYLGGVRSDDVSDLLLTGPNQITLAGTKVKVIDSAGAERLASLFFVSPTQINYLIPAGTALGEATIMIISASGNRSGEKLRIAPVAPGLFSADASGRGLAAAAILRIRANGEQSFEPISRFDPIQSRFVPVPIDLGAETDQVFLLLFGTGVRNRSSLTAATIKIGGTDAPVSYAGAQGDFAGLDQINVRLPRSLTGRGEVDVLLSVDGKSSNAVRINIR